jgi:hypothetical protein
LSNEHSEVLMQPGDKKNAFLTPHTPGTYDRRCADHDWDGMVGGIAVKSPHGRLMLTGPSGVAEVELQQRVTTRQTDKFY